MEHTTDQRHPSVHKKRVAAALRIAEILQGVVLGCAAYLLGTCPLPLGTFPLGVALLCASKSKTLYVYAGLCLSTLHAGFPLPTWAGLLLYTGILAVRFLPSFRSNGQASNREKRIPADDWLRALATQWKTYGTDEDEIAGDYYRGKKNTPISQETELSDPSAIDLRPSAWKTVFFCESTKERLLISLVAGFFFGLGGMIQGGFAVYDLLSCLLLLMEVPLLTYLLSFSQTDEGEKLLFSGRAPDALPRRGYKHLLEHFSIWCMVSVLFLLFFCTMGAKSHVLTLYSPYISLRAAPILALILSLRVTAMRGVIPGITVAMVCGLGADPMLSPAFILGAMAYGALYFLSPKVATVGGCMAAILWTAFAAGIQNMVAYLPSLLLAWPICLTVETLSLRFPLRAKFEENEEAGQDFASAMRQKTRAEAHRLRLEALSGAFSSLSRMFYDLSGELKRPKMNELRRMCDEVIDRHCARCQKRGVCDKASCHPADLLAARLSSQLFKFGKADRSSLPPETASECRHLVSIIEDVNARCARLSERLMKSEKTEVFATDYESVADIIRDTLNGDEEDFKCNHEAADKIYDCLSGRGVTVLGVLVCGVRNCRIMIRGRHFDLNEHALGELRAEMEDICAIRLTEPTVACEEGVDGVSIMQLASAEYLDADFSGSTVPAGAISVGARPTPPLPLPLKRGVAQYAPPATCGDHIAVFKTDSACFYAIISDGMGSGEEASLTSEICTLFLEKMLSAGTRVELSVRMLNSFIRQKNNGTGEECSATVDLMELDLISGEAVFAKSGAAPTYIVRNGRVYKLRSRSLPIGILKESDPQLLRFTMHPGDVVVMVSDGVTGGDDECPWLIRLLSSPIPESMDALRLEILRRAIAQGSPDDLSAIAIRVIERQDV